MTLYGRKTGATKSINRINGMKLYVYDDISKKQLCGTISGFSQNAADPIRLKCQLHGRYIRMENNRAITICNVEIRVRSEENGKIVINN